MGQSLPKAHSVTIQQRQITQQQELIRILHFILLAVMILSIITNLNITSISYLHNKISVYRTLSGEI
jgi:hypothetical protein